MIFYQPYKDDKRFLARNSCQKLLFHCEPLPPFMQDASNIRHIEKQNYRFLGPSQGSPFHPVSNRKLAFQYKEVVSNHKNYLAEQTNHKNYILDKTKTNKCQNSPFSVDRWPCHDIWETQCIESLT